MGGQELKHRGILHRNPQGLRLLLTEKPHPDIPIISDFIYPIPTYVTFLGFHCSCSLVFFQKNWMAQFQSPGVCWSAPDQLSLLLQLDASNEASPSLWRTVHMAWPACDPK